MWALSGILLLLGVAGLYYAFDIYPTLVPYHGAGEHFELARYNQYHYSLPLYGRERLLVTVQGNATFRLTLDEQPMGENTTFHLTVSPTATDHYFHLTADKPVAGSITMRRETPLAYAVLPSLFIVLGGVTLALRLKHQQDPP